MEKPKEIQSSAEIVISKITDKESVITVTLNNPLERGNDSGRDAGSMPRDIDDREEVGIGSKRRKWGGQYCSAVDCHSSTYRDGPRGVKFFIVFQKTLFGDKDGLLESIGGSPMALCGVLVLMQDSVLSILFRARVIILKIQTTIRASFQHRT